MKQKLKYLFTPNAQVSSSSFRKIMFVEILVILLIWHFNQSNHLPGPLAVISAIGDLFLKNNFLNNLLTSFFLSISALVFSVFLSLIVSYCAVMPIGKPFAVLLTKFRFSAFSGFVFIFCLIFPSGFIFKVYSLAFAVIPWIITGAISEFDDVEKMRYTHLRTLGIPEWKIARELIIYGKAAKISEIVRQNYAMIWMMIATVEAVYISEGGIGALLEMLRKYLSNLPQMLGIQLTVFILAIFVDNIFKSMNKSMFPWAYMQNEHK